MPLYEYRCTGCGRTSNSRERADRCVTPCCNAEGRRVFGFQFNKPMPGHFNHSLGKYVTNEQAFADGLKAKSEEMEARTGIPTNLQPIDPTDRKALGVTDEGLVS